MRMAFDLDENSDLTFFFVQNINDETEIVVEKKVKQREKRKEMGKVFKRNACVYYQGSRES